MTELKNKFEEMEDKATTNKLKGKKGGDCNRTQCQAPGASSWNTGSLSWYCHECAVMLNEANPVAYHQPPMVDVLPDHTFDYESELRLQEFLKSAKSITTDHHTPKSVRNNGFTPGPATPQQRTTPKVGRNDPCPCNSKKKYKKCCGNY
jgi:hypothetical protein